MVQVTLQCAKCQSEDIEKNGTRNGVQKYHCCRCGKYFQLNYTYKACQPGTEEQVWKMSHNGSGTRDIGRVLGISKDTVTAILKKKSH